MWLRYEDGWFAECGDGEGVPCPKHPFRNQPGSEVPLSAVITSGCDCLWSAAVSEPDTTYSVYLAISMGVIAPEVKLE